jgi:NTF2-related export protein 1/2
MCRRLKLPAAQKFVDAYYKALSTQGERSTLASFYVQPTVSNPIQADISINGNIVATPADLQFFFQTKVQQAHYEPQSYDCHVLNPNYNIGASDNDLGPDASGRKMSLLIVVSGRVRYGERSAQLRGFSENFVLVPNFQTGIGGPGRNWSILSQNFRIVFEPTNI